MSSEHEICELRREINGLVNRGVIFSIVWLAGAGSLIALVSGIKALRLIKQRPDIGTGKIRAGICLVLGGLGLLFWVGVILYAIFHPLLAA